MSIQRGINQLLYTTAIAAGVYRKKLEGIKAEQAEQARVKGLEASTTPRKNVIGRNITPRAGSAESEVNRAALKELTEARKEAFLKNPTEENRSAYIKTQGDLNELEKRRSLAIEKARQKISAKITQQEERKNFLNVMKGLPPEDQERFKALSAEEKKEFANFIAGKDAEEIVSKLPPSVQLQAFYQTRNK